MASKSQSRGTSPPRSSRRPKLMRACATAPSLATSNALRKDLASLQSPRATTILSRVASYSTNQQPPSCGTSLDESPRSSSIARKDVFQTMGQEDRSGSYFSFPCFEDFQIRDAAEAFVTSPDKGISWVKEA